MVTARLSQYTIPLSTTDEGIARWKAIWKGRRYVVTTKSDRARHAFAAFDTRAEADAFIESRNQSHMPALVCEVIDAQS